MKTQHISEFVFDIAIYLITDDLGNKAILTVDYKNGRFKLDYDEFSYRSADETKKIAKNLIKRKKEVNFAEKVENIQT